MCSKSNQVKGQKQARLGSELPCLSALLAEEVVRSIRDKVNYGEQGHCVLDEEYTGVAKYVPGWSNSRKRE